MARRHGSTAQQRAAWVSQLLAGSGTYGLVTLLSQTAGVSRQTLYTLAEQRRAALEQARAQIARSADQPGLLETINRQSICAARAQIDLLAPACAAADARLAQAQESVHGAMESRRELCELAGPAT
jgi:hypothetical protein